jgi:hypothetical protein
VEGAECIGISWLSLGALFEGGKEDVISFGLVLDVSVRID